LHLPPLPGDQPARQPMAGACLPLPTFCVRQASINEGRECTGVEDLCFEPRGAVATNERYLFVGDGRGAYAPVEGYSFVGDGAGNYDLMGTVLRGASCRKWCLWCLCAPALLCLLMMMLYTLLMSSPASHGVSFVQRLFWAPAPDRGSRFDCSLPPSPLADGLTAAWLAADENRDGLVTRRELEAASRRGRLPHNALTVLVHAAGDSALGRSAFSGALDEAGIKLRGVDPTSQASVAAVASWPAEKKRWCCSRLGRGCPASSTTPVTRAATSRSSSPSTPAPCTTGPPGPLGVWMPHDCDAGYSDWEHSWPAEKKRWCCGHYGRGCPELAAALPSGCHDVYANPNGPWPPGIKLRCCQANPRGCEAGGMAASQPYDCHAGITHWQKGWSDAKKSWCCHHEGRGCAARAVSHPYDCHAGLSNWWRGWSLGKKDWCCRRFGLGCGGKTTKL